MSSRNRIGVVAVNVVAEVPTEATHRKFGMHGKLGRAVGRLVKVGGIGCGRSGTICSSPPSTTTRERTRERNSGRQRADEIRGKLLLSSTGKGNRDVVTRRPRLNKW